MPSIIPIIASNQTYICTGVLSVSLEGESRDQVVVTGAGIDSVCLTNKMRKKFCHATLVSVVDKIENASSNDDGGGGGEEQKEEETNSKEKADDCHCAHNYINYPPPPCPSSYYVVYDPYGPYPSSTCSILWKLLASRSTEMHGFTFPSKGEVK